MKGTLLADCNNLLTIYFIYFSIFIKTDLLATSQLFLQASELDDQLPVSTDGSLLTAGRSHAPTRFLTPMKSVVNAVSAIVEDVQLFEWHSQWRLLISLNAAASPVSVTITEIGMTICIRKALHIEQDGSNVSSSSSPVPPNSAASNSGFSPSLHSVEEVKPTHQKKVNSGASPGSSSRRMDMFGSPGPRFGDSRAAAVAASPPSS